MTTTPSQPNRMKEFDKKVWKRLSDNSFNFNGPWKLTNKKLIVDFIDSEVTQALAGQRGEIVKKITELHSDHSRCPLPQTCIGYENAKEDIIISINEGKA